MIINILKMEEVLCLQRETVNNKTNKKIFLVGCVVVFCEVYDSLKYRSARKYHYFPP